MKYELDTIPVWDAVKEDCECPLCLLEDKAEKDYLKFYLGPSVMNPETRIEVNKTGFCNDHYVKLFQGGNQLGLGLMSHTYLQALREKITKTHTGLAKEAEGLEKGGLFASKKGVADKLGKYNNIIEENETNCMICGRMDERIRRYVYTLLYLWKKDADFNKALKESKGYCLHHTHLLNEMAPQMYGGKDLASWTKDLTAVQEKNLQRLEEEILWFTQKFDQRYKDEPWGNSKDALQRLLQKLTGTIVS